MAGSRGGCRRRGLRVLGVLAVLGVLGLALGHELLIDRLTGSSARAALVPGAALSPAARELVARCAEGLDPARRVDLHTHLAGQGHGSACWVNPRMRSLAHPVDWVRYRSYLSAAGVQPDDPDLAFVESLEALASASPLPARHVLLAFDHRYDASGARDLERSEFFVPNEYAHEVAAAHPGRFLAAISVHPYRADAVLELERWAARGARVVKWLPNAQGIDPASERCDAYYAALARLDLLLLVHTGREMAVDAAEDQELGNPLRLRRALDAGVTVIAAHCASSGESQDLDHPARPRVPSFELFLRLMDEPRHAGRLFGELSTITQINRFPRALERLLDRPDLHARLVDGSDWPLPGIDVLYSTRALERAGFLDPQERAALEELYDFDPLLFDLCLKRTVRSPSTGRRFSAEAFLVPEAWRL